LVVFVAMREGAEAVQQTRNATQGKASVPRIDERLVGGPKGAYRGEELLRQVLVSAPKQPANSEMAALLQEVFEHPGQFVIGNEEADWSARLASRRRKQPQQRPLDHRGQEGVN
jgi:hypothetical protein